MVLYICSYDFNKLYFIPTAVQWGHVWALCKRVKFFHTLSYPTVYINISFITIIDTEDASETDLAKHDEADYVEIKEQYVFIHDKHSQIYQNENPCDDNVYATFLLSVVMKSNVVISLRCCVYVLMISGCIKTNWLP